MSTDKQPIIWTATLGTMTATSRRTGNCLGHVKLDAASGHWHWHPEPGYGARIKPHRGPSVVVDQVTRHLTERLGPSL